MANGLSQIVNEKFVKIKFASSFAGANLTIERKGKIKGKP